MRLEGDRRHRVNVSILNCPKARTREAPRDHDTSAQNELAHQVAHRENMDTSEPEPSSLSRVVDRRKLALTFRQNGG